MTLRVSVADRVYWAGRYIERAEDTARLVRAFGDLIADMPGVGGGDPMSSWTPLLAVFGNDELVSGAEALAGATSRAEVERDVVRALVSDEDRPGSVVSSVTAARENLRTTREVLPREAWHAINDCYLYVRDNADRVLLRRFREMLLARVIDDSRRLDGILTSTMTRDAGYELWRLGRFIERADMTTRVVGVRAQTLLNRTRDTGPSYDEVHWMGVLRSLSALQMYERASYGPIEGLAVVRFLLFDARFPRSVACCLDEVEASLHRLPHADDVVEAVHRARVVLFGSTPAADEGADLDHATDRVQRALAGVSGAITDRFLSVSG